jgi:hypothetical protein
MNKQYNKYFYLIKENDLDNKSSDKIEESLRKAGLNVLCNKSEEYLLDNVKDYLNKIIIIEPCSVKNPNTRFITHRQFLKHMFENFHFFSVNGNLSISTYFNKILEINNSLSFEIKIKASEILFGKPYFNKIIENLNTDEQLILSKILKLEDYITKKIFENLHTIDNIEIFVKEEMRKYTLKYFTNKKKID